MGNFRTFECFGTILRYQGINRAKAEGAWQQLIVNVSPRSPTIETSKRIAVLMGVSTKTAGLYRRLFHALDLIENCPGHYVPDDPRDSIPAILTVLPDCEWEGCQGHHSLSAFSDHLGPFDPLILNQDNPLGRSTPNEAQPSRYFIPRRYARLNSLAHANYHQDIRVLNSGNFDEPNSPVAREAIAEVLLMPQSPSHRVEQAELHLVAGEPLSLSDIEASLGVSRATAKRRVQELIDCGRLERISRGQYQAPVLRALADRRAG